MNSPKINDNILEQLFCITLTKSNLNELLEKCSKSEFKKIVENCFARIQIDGHTLIGRISGVCFPVKVQSFQFGLRFHLAMIGLIPLEQILDELPSSTKEFIPWIQDLKKFKMEPPCQEKIMQKFDELNRIISHAKFFEKSNGNEEKTDGKGKDEKILNEKCPAERFMENKNCQKTDDPISKEDDKNKEANSELQKEISDDQQPTSSKKFVISEENMQFKMYIEEIVGTSEQLGEIFRILISPNEIIHLMQLGKEKFECIMKGLFIYFRMDSKILNFPVSLKQFVAQIEGIEWPSFQSGQLNYPNFRIKHFGLIQFSNIITHAHPNLMKLCLKRMDELGFPPPSKEFIQQKHQQLSDARLTILNMPQKPLSPKTKFTCTQNKSNPRKKTFPPAKYSCFQDNTINQGKLLPPTKVLNSQIWIQQSPMFNPSNLISTSSSGENVVKIIHDKQKSSSVAYKICFDAIKNANSHSQRTTNLSSTSEIMENNKDSSHNKSKNGSKQVPVILQKENMLRKSNIPEKIHNEKTIEKNNDDSGKSKTIFNSPKKQNENGKKPMNTNLELLKKRKAPSPSSSTSSEKRHK